MPSYRPGHSCELLPGRQHLGTTFLGRTVLARKSKSKLETETREESKRKGRREGNGAVSNYFYDGAKE